MTSTTDHYQQPTQLERQVIDIRDTVTGKQTVNVAHAIERLVNYSENSQQA